jgi:hypothetical protein
MKKKTINSVDLKKADMDRFSGRHVAIFHKKVIGWGHTVLEAYQMAKVKMPNLKSDQILLRFVPQESMLILYLL